MTWSPSTRCRINAITGIASGAGQPAIFAHRKATAAIDSSDEHRIISSDVTTGMCRETKVTQIAYADLETPTATA